MILRWMRDKICHFSEAQMAALDVDAYDLMTMKAAKIPAGSDGLILLPFFTGERRRIGTPICAGCSSDSR